MTSARRSLNNQRGVALPMAMLALIILSALVIGFSVLSATEPTIANNQLMVAQARALAEAGVERAIWALNNPVQGAAPSYTSNPQGICPGVVDAGAGCVGPVPASWTPPAAYNGSQLIPVSSGGNNIGGFKVTVAAATTTPRPPECPATMTNAEVCIVSRGWVPNDTTTNPKALQKITVTIINPKFAFGDPPAALSVRGELEVGGNSLVDSRSDTSCGKKTGTMSSGNTEIKSGAADIWGATDTVNPTTHNDITDAANGPLPSSIGDGVKDVSASAFDKYIWSDADISTLRAYAKANNGKPGVTYITGTAATSVTYNASNPMPNGLIFVDTVDGTNITQEGVSPATPSSDFASVTIHGNAGSGPGGAFDGWLFVNGSLFMDGTFLMHGLAYAQNDISYHGIGTGGVWGAMMSRNIRDTSSTSIDSDLLGNALVNYNCKDAKTGGDSLPSKWSLEAGTYKELSGS